MYSEVMHTINRNNAIQLRKEGHSLNEISKILKISKSSASVWVRNVPVNPAYLDKLKSKPYSKEAIERRRQSRLKNEKQKREKIMSRARQDIKPFGKNTLFLIGVMLYAAEGGKTQRLVRFSNGDPEMIKIMMCFFRKICNVPEPKFRGHIHIHEHYDNSKAEKYWSKVSGIQISQFFKTYNKHSPRGTGKRETLPFGVMDIYVLDTKLFLKIQG